MERSQKCRLPAKDKGPLPEKQSVVSIITSGLNNSQLLRNAFGHGEPGTTGRDRVNHTRNRPRYASPRRPLQAVPEPYAYEPCYDVDPMPDYENVLTD